MDPRSTAIPDVVLLSPKKHSDSRGFLSEVYSRRALAAVGIDVQFVQDNHTYTRERGVIRGLHFQTEPMAQDKLVRVVRGAILDVAVDLRRGSPTFGRHVAETISAKSWTQIYVPRGFAHGFCTLEPDCEVIYRLSNYYSSAHERGVLWDDPALGIDWPVTNAEAKVLERDRGLPPLAQLVELF